MITKADFLSSHLLSPAETVCNTTLGDKQCGGPECYKVEQECDFSPDCTDGHDEAMCGACDFEDHKLCGYVHDMSADVRIFFWISLFYSFTTSLFVIFLDPTSIHDFYRTFWPD